jgi:phage shock protein E
MKSLRWLILALMLLVSTFPVLVRAAENAVAKPLVIDVRTDQEWKEGHLDGAILIPYEKIGEEINKVAQEKKTKIVVYCRTGRRSGIALDTLKKLGYEDVTNLVNAKEASEKLKIPIVTGDK